MLHIYIYIYIYIYDNIYIYDISRLRVKDGRGVQKTYALCPGTMITIGIVNFYYFQVRRVIIIALLAKASGCAVEGVGLWALACWDWGFESR